MRSESRGWARRTRAGETGVWRHSRGRCCGGVRAMVEEEGTALGGVIGTERHGFVYFVPNRETWLSGCVRVSPSAAGRITRSRVLN